MLAKFTLFGSNDSGKTTTLRVLTYLLYQNADPAHYVHFQRANLPGKGILYPSPAQLNILSIPNKGGKNKSADWRLSFNLIGPKIGKSVRIALATPGDTEEEIIKNWDFACNNDVYRLSQKEPEYIKPDIFISPCSIGRARDEEMMEENWHIQNGYSIDLMYWFHLPINETTPKVFSNIQWEIDLEALRNELDENGVFDAGKRSSSVAKMTHQNKLDAIMFALLLQKKIFEILKLL